MRPNTHSIKPSLHRTIGRPEETGLWCVAIPACQSHAGGERPWALTVLRSGRDQWRRSPTFATASSTEKKGEAPLWPETRSSRHGQMCRPFLWKRGHDHPNRTSSTGRRLHQQEAATHLNAATHTLHSTIFEQNHRTA